MWVVPKADFEVTWIPRIGEEATAELRHGRKVVIVAPLPALALAGAASFAFGGDTFDKLLGVVLLVGAMGYPVAFQRSQRKLAEALSRWFGVRIQAGQLPLMNPGRFDAWREKRGLRLPAERSDGHVGAQPLDSMTLMSWSLPAPELWRDEHMRWSGIGYISRPKGWLEGTLCITLDRLMFVPARLGSTLISSSKVRKLPLSDLLSVELEDYGPNLDAGWARRRLKFNFRGGKTFLIAIDKPDDVLAELRALLFVRQGA